MELMDGITLYDIKHGAIIYNNLNNNNIMNVEYEGVVTEIYAVKCCAVRCKKQQQNLWDIIPENYHMNRVILQLYSTSMDPCFDTSNSNRGQPYLLKRQLHIQCLYSTDIFVL